MTTTAHLHPQLARVLLALPSADLAILARDAHLNQCRTCRVEQCPTGAALDQATAANDLPGYGQEPDHLGGTAR